MDSMNVFTCSCIVLKLCNMMYSTCVYHTCPGVQDPEDQRMCLELGKEVGLDIAAITKEVVENIRNTGMVSAWAVLHQIYTTSQVARRTCLARNSLQFSATLLQSFISWCEQRKVQLCRKVF